MTRPLRLGALWFAAIAVAGSAAYFSVNAALKDEPNPARTRQQLQDARRIAQYAASLRTLLDQLAGPRAGPSPHLTSAMLAELRAKVRQSQQDVLRARLDGPAYDALLAAADRLAAYVAAPQNEALRTAARRAQDDLESLIRTEIDRLEREVDRNRTH